MSYIANSWNKFKFILNPEEFESIFSGLSYFFVITDSSVEIDYKMTKKETVFNGYKDFFEQILIGHKKLSEKEKIEIEHKIHISITDDIQKIDFEEIVLEDRQVSIEFKLVREKEPVINLSPFYLTYQKNDNSLSVMYMNTDGILGLELSYPKSVSWEIDEFAFVEETSNYTTAYLYKELIKRIKNISKKAKINSKYKQFKPNFWVSKDVIPRINQNKYMVRNKLIIE